MKLRYLVLPALAALVLLCALPVHADLARLLQGTNPTAEAMVSDAGHVYVGRADGQVTAVDRATELTTWTADFAPAYGSGVRVLDLVAEPTGPLYAALSVAGNGRSEPVVALDRADGHVLWDSVSAFREVGAPHLAGYDVRADPYRLALDTGQTTPYLWVGTEHGFIVQILKANGHPSLDESGRPRQIAPAFRDVPGIYANTKCSLESGIYALTVFDGQLWAARNFGGEDKNGACANPLLTNLANTVYWLDAVHLTNADGSPAGRTDLQVPVPARLDPIDPAGAPPPRRFAAPALLDIWVDPAGSSDAAQRVYFAGAGTGITGVVLRTASTGAPDANGAFPAIQAILTTTPDKKAEFGTGGPPVPSVDLALGDGTIGSAVRGDGANLYVGTWTNGTTLPGVAPGAFLLKLNRDSLVPVGGTSGWVHHSLGGTEVDGRTFTAGDVDSLVVEPGTGKVLVGHGSGKPPYSGGGHALRTGALVVEVPKSNGPVVVQYLPTPGTVVPLQYPVAFRVDYPVDPNVADLSATVQYGSGATPSSWSTLPNFSLPAVGGNTYSLSGNVPLQGLPESMDLRLRIRAVARDGQVTTDMADGLVGADRHPPHIDAFGVVTDGGKVPHVEVGDNPPVRTDRPVFYVDGGDSLSDVDTDNSFLWIDDPSHAYPFLQFGASAGFVNGFTFDMAASHPYGPLPSRLAEGPHVVHAELVDFAGNYDFRQWSITVDSLVAPPAFTPADTTWVGSARPSWTAQFHEDVTVVSATLDGAEVPASALRVVPQHPQQNPDGARITVTAPADLPTGHLATLVLRVRDASGNEGGPYTSTLRVDTQAPAIDREQPAAGAVLGEDRPTLTARVQDPLSGIDLGSLQVLLDGKAQSARLDGDTATVPLQAPLSTGAHEVTVTVRDVAGNLASSTRSFTVDATAPRLDVRALLPDGQTAVKRGDTVTLEAVSPGEPVTVTVDARGLDAKSGAVTAVRQADGRYLATVVVGESRSGDALVNVRAVDATGHAATAQATVTLDNVPPIAFLKDPPTRVAGPFHLDWVMQGSDAQPAYSIVEAKVDDGPWRVVQPHVLGTRTTWTPIQGAAKLLFRVTVVDGAGNRQAQASNAVQTESVPSPIDTALFPSPWVLGRPSSLSVTPVPSARLANLTAELVLPDGARLSQGLTKVGGLFAGKLAVNGTAGGGELDLLLTDELGQVTRVSYPVAFVDPPAEVAAGAPTTAAHGAPAPALLLGLATLGLAAAARRRQKL